METLLAHIRGNPDISGIITGKREHKIAAFADDLLLVITKPNITLPNVMQLLLQFGKVSNFKVNVSKSEAININLPISTKTKLEQNFPFQWSPNKIKYLGILLTPDLSKLYQANFVPLIDKVDKQLKRWKTLGLSWFGKIQAIKMSIMPQILYYLQTIPIKIPKIFFQSIKRTISNFIWGDKTPRLKYETLILPKSKGGLSVPDTYRYYASIHLVRTLHWYLQSKEKIWVETEQALYKIPLSNLLWAQTTNIPKETLSHPAIAATLEIWNKHRQQLITTTPFPKFQTLIANPEFPPSLDTRAFARWGTYKER
uniref:Reverse transcriptase domain-containing protein n=1 Tax=Xenopus tropicalis TaxID=8364 RepID=A0A803JQG4_XENTR